MGIVKNLLDRMFPPTMETKIEELELDFLKKQKEMSRKLIQEQEAYQQEIMKLQNKVTEYRAKCNKEIEKLAIKCAEDTKNLEHNYHQTQEDLGIEIAEKRAELKNLVDNIEAFKLREESKDKEIERLNGIIESLIKNSNNCCCE
jgi:hypothetical protein